MTQQSESFFKIREAVDKYLYPDLYSPEERDDSPLSAFDENAKVGIDRSSVKDWDQLFDDFEV